MLNSKEQLMSHVRASGYKPTLFEKEKRANQSSVNR